MKKQILLISLCLLFMKFVSAQVLCVQCFDQNAAIGIGTSNLVANGGFENTTCGFNDYNNFSKAFKKKYNYPPSALKRDI